jgi:hypothetical protein
LADPSLSDIVLSILAGSIGAFSTGALSSSFALYRRTRTFEKLKESEQKLPSWFREIEATERSLKVRQRDVAMRDVLALIHREAKALQDRTFSQLVATSATLLGAFVVTALSLTLWRDSLQLHIASAAFDVVALIYAFIAYRRSGRFRTAWLRRRAVAELLRQWLSVEYLLAPAKPALTEHVDTLVAAWDASIERTPTSLIESVAALAHARVDELTATLENSHLSEASLRSYFAARPQRQVRWFTKSFERLEHGHRFRKTFMAGTFVTAAVAALVKLSALLIHNEGLAHIAVLILLVCIGLAGASSSSYLGQNQRSLKHRYAQQLRAIEEWVRNSTRDGIVAHLTGNVTVPKGAIVNDIRAFEQLMVVELLDWLAISTDDAMELAPS